MLNAPHSNHHFHSSRPCTHPHSYTMLKAALPCTARLCNNTRPWALWATTLAIKAWVRILISLVQVLISSCNIRVVQDNSLVCLDGPRHNLNSSRVGNRTSRSSASPPSKFFAKQLSNIRATQGIGSRSVLAVNHFPMLLPFHHLGIGRSCCINL